MGRDKSLVRWQGVPMVLRAVQVLDASGCAPVRVVGGDAVALAELGLVAVPDQWPGEGPLGGVITALRAFPGRRVMVIACDLPELSPPTVAAVIAALGGDHDVAYAVTDRPHPLCAVWSPGALPAIEASFAAGIRRMGDLIATLRAREVSVPPQDVRNVNAPSDLPQ